MPELPEVENACLEMIPYAKDQIIKKVIIREKKLREPISDDLLGLIGVKINKIFRRAKYIIFELDNGKNIIMHLGMSGSITIQTNDKDIKKHSHLDIVLENNMILRFNDPRKFGMILLEDNYKSNKYIQNCGIEPFDKEFKKDYLYKKAKNRNIPIKTFIMTNSIVVGIGNIYASEALFAAKINPETKAKDINRDVFATLSNVIVKILKSSIKSGGTTLRDHQVGLDKSGNYQNKLYVYGKKECQDCDNDITTIKQNGRTTFFCSNCQKKI
jgi:formamidopyrimidine-DNA glycosylase